MMFIGFKICLTILCFYTSVRFLGLAMDWLKDFFDGLKPPMRERRRNRDRERFDELDI